MNKAPVRSASGPSFCRTCETSNRVVGQISGQWVKPKNTRNGRPFMSLSVTVLPAWSSRRNGPPTPATADPIGDGARPPINKIAPKNSTRPPRNAANSSITREALSFTTRLRSAEAGGKAGADRLEEHRGAVMRPEQERAAERQRNQRSGRQQRPRSDPRCDGVWHG